MSKILVVDDEEDIRMLLRDTLEMAGHEVVEAGNVIEAGDVFDAEQPHGVLLDIMMPGEPGTEFLLRLKQRSPMTPVIMMTGQPSVNAAVLCLKTGASDFLTKPLDLDRLFEVLSICLADTDRPNTVILPTNRSLRRIGKYEVERSLGFGSFAHVYLAYHADDPGREPIALKVLRDDPSDMQRSAAARSRFTREAEVATRLCHENIVAIHEYGIDEDTGVPYIAMEYVEGQSLKACQREITELDYETKARIIRDVARALGVIHETGLCHRDVKPHNVMLDMNRNVKLTDFGIAKIPDSQLTRATEIVGTPSYMAPESFVSSKTDARADIFSLGIVAYLICVGRLPFDGQTLPALAYTIREERPVEPKKIREDFPSYLQGVIGKMLRKNPDERYQTAAELITDLDRFIKGEHHSGGVFNYFKTRVLTRDWA